jgi:hypothetical protein
MTAEYLPVHVEAVHGHAYAVRVPGQHTQPMPAVRPYVPQPCRCDEHKYGQNPGTDAMLYVGPDAVHLMINSAIRDGRYEDLRADYARKLHGVHADFDAAGHHARRTLAPAIEAWQRWRVAEDAKAAAA